MKCGLLGRTLGHSYSPQIHAMLGNHSYALFEKEPEMLEDFLKNGDFTGINVTMPYKQAVIPFLDVLTPIARQLGAVNTIVRRNGTLIGTNTDYFGFQYLLQNSGICPAGKKCLVLGSGGASLVVQAVLKDADAQVVVISRNGDNNYANLSRHQDAAIIVNTTPVGMYPLNGNSPVDIGLFPRLEAVVDVIYNPARTHLMVQAQRRGIPAFGGLLMLVAQAKAAAEWFLNKQIPDASILQIHSVLANQMENIVLIGMPGCGKSTIGQRLALQTGRQFVDIDAEITKHAKKTIPQIFMEDGEACFRSMETQTIKSIGKQSGLVIATGGGCVTREENLFHLHQNSKLFWLQRNISLLPTEGRPLSQTQSLSEMAQTREPLYRHFADYIIDNNGTTEDTLKAILEVLQ